MKGWDGALRRWPVGHGGSPDCTGNWLSSGLRLLYDTSRTIEFWARKEPKGVIFLDTGLRAPKIGLYIPLQSNSVSPMKQSTAEINQTTKFKNGTNLGLLSVTQPVWGPKSSTCYTPRHILPAHPILISRELSWSIFAHTAGPISQ